MPKVYNRRSNLYPKDAVFVGRPTSFGNPFVWRQSYSLTTVRVKDRAAAVSCFKRLLDCFEPADVVALIEDSEFMKVELMLAKAEWIRRNVHTLRGKDLVCWCAPQPCHADILLERANPNGG